jgi:hypothetical protein
LEGIFTIYFLAKVKLELSMLAVAKLHTYLQEKSELTKTNPEKYQ